MSSQLRVDKILPVDGAPTGGGGGIIQVVQTVKRDRTTLSSQTLVDISGMSVSITPKFNTSKILIHYSLMVFSNAQYWSMRLVRNSDSTIFIGDTNANATSQTRGSFGSYQSSYVTAETVVQCFLDSPNTTSATTYKLQAGHPYTSSYTLGINASAATENGNYMTAGCSTITAMEVSA
tara:strand:- start:976 stop:1509 length:534 start_codon:yes stop_codon:yes gene_type:complete